MLDFMLKSMLFTMMFVYVLIFGSVGLIILGSILEAIGKAISNFRNRRKNGH